MVVTQSSDVLEAEMSSVGDSIGKTRELEKDLEDIVGEHRAAELSGEVCVLETSLDLVKWEEIDREALEREGSPDGGEVVRLRVVGVPGEEEPRYYRIKTGETEVLE